MRRDNALKDSRRNIPPINDNLFINVLGKRNASRLRCLRHLFSGSLDCNHIEVTYDLTDSLKPNSKLFVIQAKSALSQKLASGDLYSLRIAFQMNTELMKFKFLRVPFSCCDCPVGMFNCSHRSALMLLIYIVQQNNTWNFEELVSMMPELIHTIAGLPIPVQIIYPRKRSFDAVETKKN